MDESKYMHSTVANLEEPKYNSCHLEDQAIKQQYASNISVGGHPDDCDNNMTVIKSEDVVTQSYVLPPFLH